jgi:DNA modification methylase
MCEIRQGDCLELMKEIPSKSIDLILCDLPYGTTACKWDSIIPFDKLWEQYNRIIKDNGAIVLFGNEPFTPPHSPHAARPERLATAEESARKRPFLRQKQLLASVKLIIFTKKHESCS